MLACWCSFHANPVWACRYNVLEVGFIDLGIEPYHLLGYVDESTPAALASKFEDHAAVALIDTNIQFELVRVGQDANHPALDYLDQHHLTRFPAAVLVSPDEQSRSIALAGPEGSFNTRLSAALQKILTSPKRSGILAKTAGTYGVILLIEGPDETENDIARAAAQAAVSEVAVQMEFMPKPIANPPEIVTLNPESLRDEEVLLWSLDLKPEDVNTPLAAVLYSRGRWIGPLFRGEQITQENLERILFVIGADCECGLDHRWLQGTMLPCRWDEPLQEATAKSLGLDPESPMVKMEMISVIRRGMGGFSAPGVPFGYREVEVGSEVATPIEFVGDEVVAEPNVPDEPVESMPIESVEPAAPSPHDEVPPIPEGVVPTTNEKRLAEVQPVEVEGPSATPVLGWGLAGLAACVVAVGIIVFMRSRKV